MSSDQFQPSPQVPSYNQEIMEEEAIHQEEFEQQKEVFFSNSQIMQL